MGQQSIARFAMLNQISFLAIFIYLSTATLFCAALFRRASPPKSLMVPLVLLGLSLHGYLLYGWIEMGPGQDLQAFNMLNLLLWLMGLGALVLYIRRGLVGFGGFLYPLSALSICLPTWFPKPEIIETAAHPGVLVHIAFSLLGFSLLALALLQAVLIEMQSRRLHHYAQWFSLPPIEVMDRLLFHLLWSGFICLSLALLLGFYFLDDLLAPTLIAKTILSSAAWLCFAVILWGHHYYGWRGWRTLKGTLFGALFLIVAYFGSKLWIV